jgi:hypothetical protein
MNDTVATESQGHPASVMSEKLAAMIGTKAIGLHQGQRTNFPRQQAGHMTEADQIFQRGKIRLPKRAVHI